MEMGQQYVERSGRHGAEAPAERGHAAKYPGRRHRRHRRRFHCGRRHAPDGGRNRRQPVHLMIRDLKIKDLAPIRSLHERSCSFPSLDLSSPLYLVKNVVEIDHEIVGYGCLRLTTEAIIGVDLSQPLRVRSQATDELIRTGIYCCQKLGFKDMHAFLTGNSLDSFERVLVHRFGFKKHVNPVLVLEV